MAERRMMSKKVIHSDAFLDMPISTQNLYFHLLLEGDDDGFVNSPKRVQRTIGASDDDAKLLLAKRFILSFDSGVIVIKHWRMHNYIQKDRYKETTHLEEKQKLHLKDNNVYTLDTNCTPSIGKDRLGKDSKEKVEFKSNVFSDSELNQIKSYRSLIKKPFKTQQAVTGLSNSFKECYDAGYTFKQLFDLMQEKQWQSIKLEWVKKEINIKNDKMSLMNQWG